MANVVDELLWDDGVLLDDEAATVDADILATPAAANEGQGRPVMCPPSRAGSVGSGRGRGGAGRRCSSIHSTLINRPRNQASDSSPEDVPGD